MLVCVYYRVAGCDVGRVISGVRELQRTLRLDASVGGAEVLIRCPLPTASAAEPADVPPDDAPARADATVDPEADATVMETYRLALPAGRAAADASLRAFLATLAAASLPLAGLRRGDRHVELFAPCAS